MFCARDLIEEVGDHSGGLVTVAEVVEGSSSCCWASWSDLTGAEELGCLGGRPSGICFQKEGRRFSVLMWPLACDVRALMLFLDIQSLSQFRY